MKLEILLIEVEGGNGYSLNNKKRFQTGVFRRLAEECTKMCDNLSHLEKEDPFDFLCLQCDRNGLGARLSVSSPPHDRGCVIKKRLRP